MTKEFVEQNHIKEIMKNFPLGGQVEVPALIQIRGALVRVIIDDYITVTKKGYERRFEIGIRDIVRGKRGGWHRNLTTRGVIQELARPQYTLANMYKPFFKRKRG